MRVSLLLDGIKFEDVEPWQQQRETTSASVFCHRLSAHQTHQNPSKNVTLALKYNPFHKASPEAPSSLEKDRSYTTCQPYRNQRPSTTEDYDISSATTLAEVSQRCR